MVRSGFVESRHRGVAVALAADGSTVLSAGDPCAVIFPRSANKPMQAAAMVRCGLEVNGALLALVASSHAGEPFHTRGARQILSRAGLTPGDLRCPPALPLDEQAQARFLRAGGQADRLHMNCSGKHAGMLATCVAAGWPTAAYLDPAHPLQAAVRRVVEDLAGERAAAVGVDGCGAPLFALSLAGLARAFRRMVLAPPRSAERKVADAMRAHPEWASGTGRAERALMAAVPGLLVKPGAEGVLAFALPDGRAGAMKIEDGGARAVAALAVAVLRRLGAGAARRPDGISSGPDPLDRAATVPVLGGGRQVGEIRIVLPG